YSSMLVLFLFYLKMLNLCGSALFAYTTLFRSPAGAALGRTRGRDGEAGRGGDRGGEDVPARPRHPRPAAPVHGRNRGGPLDQARSEEHTSELQSRENLVCRLLLEKKK